MGTSANMTRVYLSTQKRSEFVEELLAYARGLDMSQGLVEDRKTDFLNAVELAKLLEKGQREVPRCLVEWLADRGEPCTFATTPQPVFWARRALAPKKPGPKPSVVLPAMSDAELGDYRVKRYEHKESFKARIEDLKNSWVVSTDADDKLEGKITVCNRDLAAVKKEKERRAEERRRRAAMLRSLGVPIEAITAPRQERSASRRPHFP